MVEIEVAAGRLKVVEHAVEREDLGGRRRCERRQKRRAKQLGGRWPLPTISNSKWGAWLVNLSAGA